MRVYRFKSVAISANCARAEWNRGDASEIDCKTRGAKASEREASESRLSEFRRDSSSALIQASRRINLTTYNIVSYSVVMSIKVIIQAPGLNLQASVTDDALTELITITQKFRDQDAVSAAAAAGPATTAPESATNGSAAVNEEILKARLTSFGAAELLNQLRWDTYPEKILLLGAWHEARGGSTPWKSADMDSVFRQAKESPPSNFPRDIKVAIKSGSIQTHTPRTYSVTRTGWNRVGDALSKLG